MRTCLGCVEDLAGRACQSGLDRKRRSRAVLYFCFLAVDYTETLTNWHITLTASVSCGVEERQKEAVSDGLFKK